MNIRKLVFLLLTIGMTVTSCGVNSTLMLNNTNVTTNVELSKKNFKVISSVSGQSSATYIFGIGGMVNKALIEKAKADMLANAKIIGSAKAIINLTVETHTTLVYPLFFKRTVIASGHIIEFVD